MCFNCEASLALFKPMNVAPCWLILEKKPLGGSNETKRNSKKSRCRIGSMVWWHQNVSASNSTIKSCNASFFFSFFYHLNLLSPLKEMVNRYYPDVLYRIKRAKMESTSRLYTAVSVGMWIGMCVCVCMCVCVVCITCPVSCKIDELSFVVSF